MTIVALGSDSSQDFPREFSIPFKPKTLPRKGVVHSPSDRQRPIDEAARDALLRAIADRVGGSIRSSLLGQPQSTTSRQPKTLPSGMFGS